MPEWTVVIRWRSNEALSHGHADSHGQNGSHNGQTQGVSHHLNFCITLYDHNFIQNSGFLKHFGHFDNLSPLNVFVWPMNSNYIGMYTKPSVITLWYAEMWTTVFSNLIISLLKYFFITDSLYLQWNSINPGQVKQLFQPPCTEWITLCCSSVQ